MNTATETSIQDRYDSIRAYWLDVVAASRTIGVDHSVMNTPGVIISGKGENFGNLRIPIKVVGVVVAEITSSRQSNPGDFTFDFTDGCPEWVRAAVTNPSSIPLDC